MKHLGLSLVALLLVTATAQAAGDAAKGETLFKKKRCVTCHIIKEAKHKIGPTLNGVIGRTAGTAKGFKRYSPAMKKAGESGIVWTPETLDKYLTKPKAFVPKNRMAFPGIPKAEERADVIAYLQSFSKKAEAQ